MTWRCLLKISRQHLLVRNHSSPFSQKTVSIFEREDIVTMEERSGVTIPVEWNPRVLTMVTVVLSGNAVRRARSYSQFHTAKPSRFATVIGQPPLRKLIERGSKSGRCGPRNHQDGRKSRRINAESRRNPRPTAIGITPKEAAIQASGSTRAMSVKVIM